MLHRIIACVLAAVIAVPSVQAQSLADVIAPGRPYELQAQTQQPPKRQLRFWIGENSAFAVCGKCLCLTGVMIARFPRLGIRTTSGSPTFACDQASREFEADARLASRFMNMKRAEVTQDTVVFTNPDGDQMVFRLGAGDLRPPE